MVQVDKLTFAVTRTGGIANAKVTAIRVQDIERQIWFNWDSAWDVLPRCNPGSNKLYVAVWAINQGTVDGNITLQLVNTTDGTVLVTKTELVAVGNGLGIEWTGAMPTVNFNLTCKTDNDAVQFQVVPTTSPPTCPPGYHWDATQNACVADTPPSPDYRVPLIIAGAVGVGAVAYLSTRKKQKKPAKS